MPTPAPAPTPAPTPTLAPASTPTLPPTPTPTTATTAITATTNQDGRKGKKKKKKKHKPHGPPPLAIHVLIYQREYLQAIISCLTKYDAKYLHGGEYATNPNLQSLHLHTSTWDVERVFGRMDRLFHLKNYNTRAPLLAAVIKAQESPRDPTHLLKYHERFQVLAPAPSPINATRMHEHIMMGLTYPNLR
jgi:hypothetical protein